MADICTTFWGSGIINIDGVKWDMVLILQSVWYCLGKQNGILFCDDIGWGIKSISSTYIRKYREDDMPTISVLIKPASGMCNMQCDYCFYCDEMKKGHRIRMGLCQNKH